MGTWTCKHTQIQACVLSHPEYDVVAEHQVFVAAADFGTLVSIVVHLGKHNKRCTRFIYSMSQVLVFKITGLLNVFASNEEDQQF